MIILARELCRKFLDGNLQLKNNVTMNTGPLTLKPGATTPLNDFLQMVCSHHCRKVIRLLINNGMFKREYQSEDSLRDKITRMFFSKPYNECQ